MPFDWRAYFKLAKVLVSLASNRVMRMAMSRAVQEACWRTGVSRAYYAAYCYARNHARDHLGFQPRRAADDHAKLREHLGRDLRYVEVADLLNQLRLWRNQCDYDDIAYREQEIAGNAIRYAQEIFHRLEAMIMT